MKAKRIIPCLDTRDGRVVKGVKFVDIRDAGDPVETARRFDAEGADELVFLDITATNEGRKTTLDAARRVVEAISIPLTVGGGISDLDGMAAIFDAGVSKVSINSAAIRRPALIDEAVARFGSDRIVVAIDCQAREGVYEVLINGGQVQAGRDMLAWALEVENRGAGEILLTSKDADGTKNGYDLTATRMLADALRIPVIASGGAGRKEDFFAAFAEGKADAALAASLFHFREVAIPELKDYLEEQGIPVRRAK